MVRSLTAREREFLDLIAEGCTNREIGQRWFLAEKTVKNYVSALLAKLGMQRRTQAAVYGSNLGSPPPADLRPLGPPPDPRQTAHVTDLKANDLGPLGDDELAALDAWWRACNYLTIGQIYLKDNALLRRTLSIDDIKPRLLGHWAPAPACRSSMPM